MFDDWFRYHLRRSKAVEYAPAYPRMTWLSIPLLAWLPSAALPSSKAVRPSGRPLDKASETYRSPQGI